MNKDEQTLTLYRCFLYYRMFVYFDYAFVLLSIPYIPNMLLECIFRTLSRFMKSGKPEGREIAKRSKADPKPARQPSGQPDIPKPARQAPGPAGQTGLPSQPGRPQTAPGETGRPQITGILSIIITKSTKS